MPNDTKRLSTIQYATPRHERKPAEGDGRKFVAVPTGTAREYAAPHPDAQENAALDEEIVELYALFWGETP